MSERGSYNTRQKALVIDCLTGNQDRYLGVDDVLVMLHEAGKEIGRTTIYRNLEALVTSGQVLKATFLKGEARYRLAPGKRSGQLVCLSCGCTLPLDCTMLSDFAVHVQTHHGFEIDSSRTVLYGLCASCAQKNRKRER